MFGQLSVNLEKKIKLDPFITPYTEINFRWLESIKVEECKAVKEKYGFS